MQGHIFKSLLVSYVLTFSLNCEAQQMQDDSGFYKIAVSKMVSVYHKTATDQAGIFNGSQYIKYPFAINEGHPYFQTDKLTYGSVEYDGILYDSVLLLYDEINDALITEDIHQANLVELIYQKISRFNILGQPFIKVAPDSGNRKIINPGLYQLLYDGKTMALKKERKEIRETIVYYGPIDRVVDTKADYYVKHREKYYKVTNAKTLLAVLKDRKKEISQYLKKNKLKFKKAKDNTLIKAVAYYDQLTK